MLPCAAACGRDHPAAADGNLADWAAIRQAAFRSGKNPTCDHPKQQYQQPECIHCDCGAADFETKAPGPPNPCGGPLGGQSVCCLGGTDPNCGQKPVEEEARTMRERVRDRCGRERRAGVPGAAWKFGRGFYSQVMGSTNQITDGAKTGTVSEIKGEYDSTLAN